MYALVAKKRGMVSKRYPKIRLGDLREERAIIFKNKVIEWREWNLEADTTMMWNQTTYYIRRIANEVLGELKGND